MPCFRIKVSFSLQAEILAPLKTLLRDDFQVSIQLGEKSRGMGRVYSYLIGSTLLSSKCLGEERKCLFTSTDQKYSFSPGKFMKMLRSAEKESKFNASF